MKKSVAEAMKKTALYFTEKSVGKSMMWFSYEVKVPEQLKEKKTK